MYRWSLSPVCVFFAKQTRRKEDVAMDLACQAQPTTPASRNLHFLHVVCQKKFLVHKARCEEKCLARCLFNCLPRVQYEDRIACDSCGLVLSEVLNHENHVHIFRPGQGKLVVESECISSAHSSSTLRFWSRRRRRHTQPYHT